MNPVDDYMFLFRKGFLCLYTERQASAYFNELASSYRYLGVYV